MLVLLAILAGWISASLLLVSLTSAASRGDRQLSRERPNDLWLPPVGERTRLPHPGATIVPWPRGRRSTDVPPQG